MPPARNVRNAKSSARNAQSKEPASPQAKDPHADLFAWIRESQGTLNMDNIDILLDVSQDKSAIDAPDLAELGSDAAWIHESGVTPVEFLVRMYRHPLQKPSDRISAARAVLEYAHKRVQKLELSGKVEMTKKVDPTALSNLSDKELETFTALLEKMGA